MKKTITIVLAAVAVSATAFAQKKAKVRFEFPDEMPENIRSMNVPLVEKGLALYQLTCAQCHSRKVRGKEWIPDFTMEQLELYEIRIANQTHESELTERSLTAEELSLITTFFMYKKKNDDKRARK